MEILFIETATEKGAIILSREGRPLAVQRLEGGPGLSRSLASQVGKLLCDHSFQPDLIAVGQGPGSFTGIRVGAALGQALSYGWKIPLTGFGSLQGFAPAATGPFAVLVDARSGGFYTLLGEGEAFDTPFLLPLQDAKEVLKNIAQIASPHPQLIQQRFKEDKIWFETEPDPALLTRLVLRKPKAPLELIY